MGHRTAVRSYRMVERKLPYVSGDERRTGPHIWYGGRSYSVAAAQNRMGVESAAMERLEIVGIYDHDADGARSRPRGWSCRNRRYGHGCDRRSGFGSAGSNSTHRG